MLSVIFVSLKLKNTSKLEPVLNGGFKFEAFIV